MKKLFALILAVCMISSMVISTYAAEIVTLKMDKVNEFAYDFICGADANESKKVCWKVVKKVRFTFDSPGYVCGNVPGQTGDDGNPAECNGKCSAVAVIGGPISWYQKDFCYTDTKVVEVDLNAQGWGDGVLDNVDYYIKVGAASFVPGNDKGTAKVEAIGADGNVLAPGTGCKTKDCVGTPNCREESEGGNNQATQANNQATQANNQATQAAGATAAATNAANRAGNNALNTGVGGVMAFGGMAVIAVGAVVLSRKKK